MAPNTGHELYKQIVELAFHVKKKVVYKGGIRSIFERYIYKLQ